MTDPHKKRILKEVSPAERNIKRLFVYLESSHNSFAPGGWGGGRWNGAEEEERPWERSGYLVSLTPKSLDSSNWSNQK